MKDEYITITTEEYFQLRNRDLFLLCLEDFDLTTWHRYEEAVHAYEREIGKE